MTDANTAPAAHPTGAIGRPLGSPFANTLPASTPDRAGPAPDAPNPPPAGETLGEEVAKIWVRFKQMAHIPPGETVRPGDIRQIPADHFHTDVHEEVDSPTGTAAPVAPSPTLSAAHLLAQDAHDRLDDLERTVVTSSAFAALRQDFARLEARFNAATRPALSPPPAPPPEPDTPAQDVGSAPPPASGV